MYDLSQPNAKPGTCCKCRGTGVYGWGAIVNGVPSKSGPCFSCRGTGKQSAKQIRRNHTYNRFKIADIVRADFAASARYDQDPGYVDPGELAEDRWNETHGDRF